jgi:hypothetical protein
MKLFTVMQLYEAMAHARSGGQALHVFDGRVWGNPTKKAPGCFERSARAGKPWAHLFDQNYTRLKETAVRLGVRVIMVHYLGTDRQHIDLCGRPLERAIGMAEPAECEVPAEVRLAAQNVLNVFELTHLKPGRRG